MQEARRLDYVVEPEDGYWTVRLLGGSRAGRFSTRIAALRSAAIEAARARCLGYEACVSLRAMEGGVKRLPPRVRTPRPH
jgi:hypothetical protein